jgi:hypothetical protein
VKTKLFEIRDRATFIPCIAIECEVTPELEEQEKYLLRRAGYMGRCFLFGRLVGGGFHYDCYDWSDRTMRTAHEYIEKNWEKLQSGDVIDVEYILGETKEPKVSEFVELV